MSANYGRQQPLVIFQFSGHSLFLTSGIGALLHGCHNSCFFSFRYATESYSCKQKQQSKLNINKKSTTGTTINRETKKGEVVLKGKNKTNRKNTLRVCLLEQANVPSADNPHNRSACQTARHYKWLHFETEIKGARADDRNTCNILKLATLFFYRRQAELVLI